MLTAIKQIYLFGDEPLNNRRLYLVGNGFDLWHGIPSSYASFKSYVQQHNLLLFEAIEDYLPAGPNWNQLESALADIDVDHVIDELGQFMMSYGADDWSDAGHHDFQYETKQLVQLLSTGLREEFAHWIRQLPIPSPGAAQQRLQTIDPVALFLNFNYTSTLRDLYTVADSRVLHIHGRADHRDCDLVLGHAWNPTARLSLNDRPDIEEIDTRLMEVHDILDSYFSSTFKPAVRIIEENSSFFHALSQVREVLILGHSLSPVDEPYLRAIIAEITLSEARWVIASRDQAEGVEKQERLVELGIQRNCIDVCLWSSI